MMKDSEHFLLVLLMAVIAGGASAQNSLQVYGRLDASHSEFSTLSEGTLQAHMSAGVSAELVMNGPLSLNVGLAYMSQGDRIVPIDFGASPTGGVIPTVVQIDHLIALPVGVQWLFSDNATSPYAKLNAVPAIYLTSTTKLKNNGETFAKSTDNRLSRSGTQSVLVIYGQLAGGVRRLLTENFYIDIQPTATFHLHTASATRFAFGRTSYGLSLGLGYFF